MADSVTTKNQLKLLAGFTDEDDRTISLEDPIEGITWTDITNLANLSSNVLIGDKFQAPFTRFKWAKYVETTVTEVDTDVQGS